MWDDREHTSWAPTSERESTGISAYALDASSHDDRSDARTSLAVQQIIERWKRATSSDAPAMQHVSTEPQLPLTVVEVDLVWALADVVDPYLTAPERHNVYITIAVGETFSALSTLLGVAARRELTLSADVGEALHWILTVYEHHEDEPRMRLLMGRVSTVSLQDCDLSKVTTATTNTRQRKYLKTTREHLRKG
jgi:hypothetical protein